MTNEIEVEPVQQDSFPLKLPQPEVDSLQPWSDDLLGRKQVAEKLTNMIQDQSVPFVVSIDGYWGTGKTFLLQRWQQDLANSGFRAIYFNAWEDDFCDDPLIAIIGQLTDHFKDGKFSTAAGNVRKTVGPLILQNAQGVLKKHTGLTVKLEQSDQDPLDVYAKQRATKDQVKRGLGKLSEKVREDTGKPVVFIIDELDRCRPTFAVELLERVKHIFDVPGMVFVFGINRDELCSSLRSIYGEISADIYLRRFFDMEFTLPEVDAETFCRQLMDRFMLGDLFRTLSQQSGNTVPAEDYRTLHRSIPAFWSRFGLSLRDIDYCVRSIALVGRNLNPRQPMHPWYLGILIPLKIANNVLYREFTRGRASPSEVMNYVDGMLDPQIFTGDHVHDDVANTLNVIEALLYMTEVRPYGQPAGALGQLELLRDGESLTTANYLSTRTQAADEDRARRLLDLMSRGLFRRMPSGTVKYAANLIDLHQEVVRR